MSTAADIEQTGQPGSTEKVDLKKRRFLVATTSVIGAAGAAAMAVPFLSSFSPSERARAAGAPVEVDLTKVQPGQLLRVECCGKPVWVVRRTEEMLKLLEKNEARLRDPDSEVASQQPAYAKNKYRSIKPEFLILVGICTHLGCIPLGQKSNDPKGEFGGWFCPCHGSHYNTSGRIRKGPAPENLPIPPYKYISDTKIKIG